MVRLSKEHLHLGAIISAGPGGYWRYPTSEQFRFLDATYYQEIARTLERGRFDFIFFANKVSLPGRSPESIEGNLRNSGWGVAHPDPLLLLTAIATATERIGLASTISTSYEAPFHVARAVATLDHLSKGRAAWNVVTSTEDAEAQNFGLDRQREHTERYELADEFLRVAHGLWDTWEDDAVLMDREAGVAVDPARVHPLNHEGKYFRVRGPLNLPRPPQGYPVIAQAGASDLGRDFAARWSEVIFTPQPLLKVAQAFYGDIKARAAAYGRNPNDIKVLPGVLIVTGESEAIVREKEELLKSLGGGGSPQTSLAERLEVDASVLSPDAPAAELLARHKVRGMQGHMDAIAHVARERNMTVAQLEAYMKTNLGLTSFARFTGTPAQIADQCEEWFREEACDGFMIRPTYLPGSMEEFVRLVVPELQRRRLFRKDYEGTTLRQNLGLARPERESWKKRFTQAPLAGSLVPDQETSATA